MHIHRATCTAVLIGLVGVACTAGRADSTGGVANAQKVTAQKVTVPRAQEFSVSRPISPYKNYKFRIRWDGRDVAGVSKVSALTRSTGVIGYRSGGDPSVAHLVPGQTKFDPITLERGVTHDAQFEQWASKDWGHAGGSSGSGSLKDFRKDLTIEMYDEAGRVAARYKIFKAWVSSITSLPDLDSASNAVAIETIVLHHEGWERDGKVPLPK